MPAESAARDLARHGEHVAALLESEVRSDERAASLARLDDDRRSAETGDDPVPRGEAPRRRLDARLVLGDDEARPRRSGARARRAPPDSRGRSRIRGRRPSFRRPRVRPGAPRRRSLAPCRSRRRGRRRPSSRASERATERPYDRARSRADDGNGRLDRAAESPRTADVEPRRRIVDRREQRWERRITPADVADLPSRGRKLSRHAVRERLGDMRRLDEVGACERRDRARDPRDAGAAATGERQPVDGAREELRRGVRSPRGRRARRRSRASRTRPRTSPTPPPAARRARPLAAVASRRRGRNDRAARARASPDTRRAAAPCKRTRPPDRPARRTGTCSSSRRAGSAPGRARDRRRARRPRRRPRAAAAATRGRSAGTPAARPEGARRGEPARPRPDAGSARRRRWPAPTLRGAARETAAPETSARPGRKQPCDRVDARDLERLVPRERREDPRQPTREHRLPGSRRPHQQEVVRAGGGDLERAAGALLSAHVRQVGPAGSSSASRPEAARTTERRSLLGSTRRPRRGGGPERARCPRARPRAPTRRRRRARRRPARRAPSATASVPDTGRMPPVERELTDGGMLGEPLRRKLPASRRAPRARSGGRIPSPPCAARPGRG